MYPVRVQGEGCDYPTCPPDKPVVLPGSPVEVSIPVEIPASSSDKTMLRQKTELPPHFIMISRKLRWFVVVGSSSWGTGWTPVVPTPSARADKLLGPVVAVQYDL